MRLRSDQAVAYHLHREIATTDDQIREWNRISSSKQLLSSFTDFITIPVELDFQVTGVSGDLVPSPKIFLAGGPPASTRLRFLFPPGVTLALGETSGFGSDSRVEADSAGVATGITGGTTASKHSHTLCNSGRRSWRGTHQLKSTSLLWLTRHWLVYQQPKPPCEDLKAAVYLLQSGMRPDPQLPAGWAFCSRSPKKCDGAQRVWGVLPRSVHRNAALSAPRQAQSCSKGRAWKNVNHNSEFYYRT